MNQIELPYDSEKQDIRVNRKFRLDLRDDEGNIVASLPAVCVKTETRHDFNGSGHFIHFSKASFLITQEVKS